MQHLDYRVKSAAFSNLMIACFAPEMRLLTAPGERLGLHPLPQTYLLFNALAIASAR